MSKHPAANYIFIIYIIFFLSLGSGYWMAVQDPAGSRQMVEQFFSDFQFAKNLSTFQLFLFIFLNNSVKAFLVMATGFFFGLVPIFFVFTNANLIGIVLVVFGARAGFLRVALSLLPHGIFEIPAILLASGYGLWLGVKFFRKIRYGEPMGDAFRFALKKYLKIILPTLLVAAFIEAYISTYLAGR